MASPEEWEAVRKNPYPRGTKEYRKYQAMKNDMLDDLWSRGYTPEQLNIKDEEGFGRPIFRTVAPGGLFSTYGRQDTNYVYDWARGRKLNIATNVGSQTPESQLNSNGQWVFNPATADPSRWEPITQSEYAERNNQAMWNAANPGMAYYDRMAMQGMRQNVARGHFKLDPASGLYYNFRNNNPNDVEWKDKFNRPAQQPKGWKPPVTSQSQTSAQSQTPVQAQSQTSPVSQGFGQSQTPGFPEGTPPGAVPTSWGPVTPPGSKAKLTPGAGSSPYVSPLVNALMAQASGGPYTSEIAGGEGNPDPTPDTPPEYPGSNTPDTPPPSPPVPTPAPGGEEPGIPWDPHPAPFGGGGGGSPEPTQMYTAGSLLPMTGDPLMDQMANLFNSRAGIFGHGNPFLSGATSRAPTDQDYKEGEQTAIPTGSDGQPKKPKDLEIGGTFLPGGGLWWGEGKELDKILSSLFSQPTGGSGGGGGGGGTGGGGYHDVPAGHSGGGGSDSPFQSWGTLPWQQIIQQYMDQGQDETPFMPPNKKKQMTGPLESALMGYY